MIDANELKITLTDIVAVLSASTFAFHLTGGLASSYYGEPRFTQDIDIVIRITIEDSLDQFISNIAKKFIIDRIATKEAIQQKGIFQALHELTMIKIDFHVGEAIPGELERSKSVEILPGVFVPLVSKEDAILSKLLWVKKGSHKSRQDIKMMLMRSGEIHLSYLDAQATMLGVQNILNELWVELQKEQSAS